MSTRSRISLSACAPPSQRKTAGLITAKHSKPAEPSQGEGASRFKGSKQHGWSPDVDETKQQDNPSAHRSFHPEEYAPGKGPGRTVSKEEAEASTGRRRTRVDRDRDTPARRPLRRSAELPLGTVFPGQ